MSQYIDVKDMDTVNAIQSIREKNNGNWMKILKIALRCSPRETKEVLKSIILYDSAVTVSLKKLVEDEKAPHCGIETEISDRNTPPDQPSRS